MTTISASASSTSTLERFFLARRTAASVAFIIAAAASGTATHLIRDSFPVLEPSAGLVFLDIASALAVAAGAYFALRFVFKHAITPEA